MMTTLRDREPTPRILGFPRGSPVELWVAFRGFYHGFTEHVFMIYMPYAGVSSSFYLEDQRVY